MPEPPDFRAYARTLLETWLATPPPRSVPDLEALTHALHAAFHAGTLHLLTALARYGSHDADCAHALQPCTCGLDDALRDLTRS